MIDQFAIIIGAMRCGTTSLFQYLAQHPQVSACPDKEPDFFARDDVWAKGLGWYRSLWVWRPGEHRIALEASTNYSKVALFPGTAARIASVDARFRFIYLMRDPLSRIESHYTLGASKGWRESRRPLHEEVARDLIDCTRYATQLDQYSTRFPCSDILLLSFEELRADAPRVVRRVCRFLGIEEDYQLRDLDLVHNANVGRRAGEPGQWLYRWRASIPFWARISRSLSARQRNQLRALFSRSGASNARLTEEQQRLVLEELADELRRLEDHYGFDTNRWQATELLRRATSASDVC